MQSDFNEDKQARPELNRENRLRFISQLVPICLSSEASMPFEVGQAIWDKPDIIKPIDKFDGDVAQVYFPLPILQHDYHDVKFFVMNLCCFDISSAYEYNLIGFVGGKRFASHKRALELTTKKKGGKK
ncbi:hypothetical protein Barb6_02763 [Bacteroidales bacterium Barb6]|nr:hypothetical protein Barb6_02763 [Bacteroidales bacterium Barb6]